jgi:hypothetical protein
MRARLVLGSLGCVTAVLIAPWACIPHPEQDFEDYQERIANFPKETVEAAAFDTSAPPTSAVEGLYYGACLSELEFGQPKLVFNFYPMTKFAPEPTPAQLTLSIQSLKVINRAPPPTISLAGVIGSPIAAPATTVDAEGLFLIQLGTVIIPGEANPVSGSEAQIDDAVLRGRFGADRFCARLGGRVIRPTAAARTLKDGENICQFVPIKDGDPTPTFTGANFQAASCPP